MWLLFATLASMFWGLVYVIDEQIYKYISVPTTLAIHTFFTALILVVVVYFSGSFKTDFETIASSNRVVWLLIAGTVALVIAELFIGFSISAKNATLAGLIEISYPLFIVLFSFLFLGSYALNAGTLVGGSLIFLGVGVIYYFGG